MIWCKFPLAAMMFTGLVCFAVGSITLPEQPNIVILYSDDHGYADMSWTGKDTGVVTPNLDRLARESLRFTQGYATSPICVPSRIGLLLGQYQQRHGNWWYGGPGLPGPEAPTIAEVLSDAGYATAMIGKIHFNTRFNESVRNHPLNHGFDYFYGFNGPAKHYLVHNAAKEAAFMESLMEHSPGNRGYPTMFYAPMWIDDEQHDQEGFATHLFRDAALDFIEANQKNPFFLYLSFNAVHDQTYQLPETWLESRGLELKPDWDPAKQSRDEWGRVAFPSKAVSREYILGQVHFLDEAIGAVLEKLEDLKLRRNTLIVYLSDNGGSILNESRNDPLRSGKFTMFEGGNRVPFFMSWPGVIPENRETDNVVSAMDLLPTFASLAGTTVPDNLDGLNLVPLLTGEDPDLEHPYLVWDVGFQWAIRQGDWKLHFVEPSRRGRVLDEGVGYRLTHLADDPGENRNLLLENPEKAADLGHLHREWLETMQGNVD